MDEGTIADTLTETIGTVAFLLGSSKNDHPTEAGKQHRQAIRGWQVAIEEDESRRIATIQAVNEESDAAVVFDLLG